MYLSNVQSRASGDKKLSKDDADCFEALLVLDGMLLRQPQSRDTSARNHFGMLL